VKDPKPAEINLSDAERQAPEKRLKAHSTEEQPVLRARIVLKASQGLNNAQIARELHVTIDMGGPGGIAGPCCSG
jgi:DNA-binding NarL/FixJ family response regulator